jgi:transglutaminase-like putative cysteine protease
MKLKQIYKKITAFSLVFVMVLTFGLAPTFGALAPGKVSNWATQSVSKGSTYGILPPAFAGKDMTKPSTRQEFAQITLLLYEKIKGVSVKVPKVNPFKDTNDISVLKAYSLGIVRGQGNGIFNPKGLLTREEAATMLTRAYTRSTGNRLKATGVGEFSDDSSISTYARPSIYYMVYKEFVMGTGNNKFTPKGKTTSEQLVTMAVRMLDEVWANEEKPPNIDYAPGMKANTLGEAQDIILDARKSLLPEIFIEMPRSIYDELLVSQFSQNRGIQKLHYFYDTKAKKLQVSISYSNYTQILALTENPAKATLYASRMAKELNLKLNDILKQEIRADMGDYEKEKALHDYMVRTYEFDTSITVYDLEHPSQSVEGPIYYNKGICQGYSEVFDLLMKKVGITSQMVWGQALGENHVWNMVKLSGEWYMVDVMWDDPVPDGGDRVSHEYFNLTGDQLALTHSWSLEQYPQALGTQFGN